MPPTDDKKTELIRIIIDCIAREGTEGLSFEQVGNLAQMKRSHVAYYFPSRQAMIEAAIRWVVQEGQKFTQERVQQARTPQEALLGSVKGAFDWLEHSPGYSTLMILFYYLASYDEAYRKLHSELRTVGEERILSLLRLAHPQSKASAKLRDRARDIQGLITGNIVGWVTTDRSVKLSDLRKRTMASALSLSGLA